MKTLTKIVFTIAILLLSTLQVCSQFSISINNVDSIQVCNTEKFTFSIENNVQNFNANDTANIVFTNNENFEISNFNILTGNASINQSIDTLSVFNFSSTENFLLIEASITIKCEGFDLFEYTEQLDGSFTVNNNSSSSFNSNQFQIYTPRLVFESIINQNYNTAQFGIPVERCFFITNTNNSIPFNGYLQFCDTLNKPLSETALIFDTISFSSNQASLENYSIEDSIVTITLQVTNLLQGDTIKVSDWILMENCVSNFNNVTRYSLKYGCNLNDYCYSDNNYLNQVTTTNYDPNDKPQILVSNRDLHYDGCIWDTVTKVNVFKNIGNGLASGIEVTFFDNPWQYSLTKIDTSSVEVYINSVNPVNLLNSNINYGGGFSSGLRWILRSDYSLSPGDSIILVHKEVTRCIDSVQYQNDFKPYHSLENIYIGFKLEHPCFESNIGYNQHKVGHKYSAEQEFLNLTSQLADNEESWLNIELTSLEIGVDYGGSSPDYIAYDLNNSLLNFKLVLDSGLSLVSFDSVNLIGLVSNVYIELPIHSVSSTSNLSGFGDTIEINFSFPYNFQSPYNLSAAHHYEFIKSTIFQEFLSNSKFNFKVKAHCDKAKSDSKANIYEELFFTIDTNCRTCKIPLNKVQSYVNINCPGCYLPGWNLTDADVSRINIGYADTNNNFYPDAFPLQQANPNDVKLKHASIGDTVEFNIEGFISDGAPQPNGLQFSDLGFTFDEGQIVFKGDISKLKFLGATGTFTHNGTVYNLTIPENAAQTYANGVTINMSVNSLTSYGATGFTGYNASSSIDLQPRFKVIGNYNDGTGSNPYASVQYINIFYYMGGEPFGQPDLITDALTIPLNTLETLPSAQQANLSYWCTAYEARFLGIGVDFQSFNPEFSKRANQNFECEYSIKQYIHAFTGNIYDQVIRSGTGNYSNNLHRFYPNELRDFWNIDSLTYYFPSDLEVSNIQLRSSNPILYNNSYSWSNYSIASIQQSDYNLTDTSITIYSSILENNLTQFNLAQNIGSRDESIHYFFTIDLTNKSCINKDKIVLPNLYSQTWMSNFPLAINGDTLIYQNYLYDSHNTGIGSNDSLYLPNPIFDISVLENSNTNSIYNLSYNFNFTIEHENGYNNTINLIDRTNNVAYNSYVIFESPNNTMFNFTVDTIWRNTTRDLSPFFPYYFQSIPELSQISGQINGSNVYQLGGLGGSQYTHQSKNFNLSANYDCSTIPFGTQDSLYVIHGWNCFDYPTDLNDACFVDTMVLYIDIPPVGADINITTPATLALCDTSSFSVEFDPTAGEIENLLIEISRNDTESLDYQTGSGILEFNGVDYPVEPVITDSNYVWILDTLSNVLGNFGELSPPATLHFELVNGCDYLEDSVTIFASATNFCGKLVAQETQVWQPINTVIVPEKDSLMLNLAIGNASSCEDSVLVAISVTNLANDTTMGANWVELIVPSNYSYASSNYSSTIINDTILLNLTTGLEADSTEEILLYLEGNGNYCDEAYLFSNLYYTMPYTCDTNTCFITNYTASSDSILISNANVGITIDSIIATQLCDSTNDLIFQYTSNSIGSLNVYNGNTNGLIATYNYGINTTGTQDTINLLENTDSLIFINQDCFCSDTTYYSVVCDEPCIVDADFEISDYCIGDTVSVIGADSALTHIWNYSYFNMTQTGFNAQFPSPNSGVFSIEHIAIANCGNSDTVTKYFNINDAIPTSIILNGTNPFCITDSIELSVSNSNAFEQFNWNTGDTTSIIYANTDGVYGVMVTDTNGCAQSCQAISLSTLLPPAITVDTLYICSNTDSIEITTNTNGTHYWFDGSTNSSVWITGPGNYEVTVCDSLNAGCCSTDTIVVLLTEAVVEVDDQISCENSGHTFTPNTLYNGTYNWSNGVVGDSSNYTQSGTHYVSFTNTYGCSKVDSFSLVFDELLNSSFIIEDTVCTSDTLTCFNLIQNDSTYTHEWSLNFNGSIVHSYETNPCFNFNNVGTIEITHIVSNSCGIDSTTQNLTVIENSTESCITIIGQNPFCEGDSVLLTSSNNFSTLEWYNENGEIIGYGDTLVVYDGGIYSALGTDENGCESTCICTELSMVNNTPFYLNDTIICDSIPITYTLPNNQNGIWSNGTYGNSSQFNSSGSYTVTSENEIGCEYTDTFNIAISDFEEFELSVLFMNKCYYLLKVNPDLPNYTYEWSHNGSLIGYGSTASFYVPNYYPFYFYSFFATFEVLITDEFGCSITKSITKLIKPCLYIKPIPNPFEDFVTVKYLVDTGENILIEVKDLKGKTLHSKPLDKNHGETKLDLRLLSKGIYLITLSVDGKINQRTKVIKN